MASKPVCKAKTPTTLKAAGYIFFLLFVFAILYLSGRYIHVTKPAVLTEDAVKPDMLLLNSKIYFQEDAHKRSISHLRNAIDAIRDLEQELDEESKAKVDHSLDQLEAIYEEMSHEEFNIKHLNEASVKALNALTYAELKLTEHYVDSDELDNARVALKHGMLHVKNALKFAEGLKKEYEIHIYHEMDSLIANDQLSDREILRKLERMIEDLDNLGMQVN